MPLDDDEVEEVGQLLDATAQLLLRARARLGPVDEVAAPLDAINDALGYVQRWLDLQEEQHQLAADLRRRLDRDDFQAVLMLESTLREAIDLAATEGYRVGLMGISADLDDP